MSSDVQRWLSLRASTPEDRLNQRLLEPLPDRVASRLSNTGRVPVLSGPAINHVCEAAEVGVDLKQVLLSEVRRRPILEERRLAGPFSHANPAHFRHVVRIHRSAGSPPSIRNNA